MVPKMNEEGIIEDQNLSALKKSHAEHVSQKVINS